MRTILAYSNNAIQNKLTVQADSIMENQRNIALS